MKAILIDPNKRLIHGIEVDYTTLYEVFTKKNTKTCLTMLTVGSEVLFLDVNATGKGFDLIRHGLPHCKGKGVLLGYAKSGKGFRSTTMTVRSVSKMVRFS